MIIIKCTYYTVNSMQRRFSSNPEIRRTYGIIDLGRNAIGQSLFIRLRQLWCLNALVKAGVYLVNGAKGLADLVWDNCGLIPYWLARRLLMDPSPQVKRSSSPAGFGPPAVWPSSHPLPKAPPTSCILSGLAAACRTAARQSNNCRF